MPLILNENKSRVIFFRSSVGALLVPTFLKTWDPVKLWVKVGSDEITWQNTKCKKNLFLSCIKLNIIDCSLETLDIYSCLIFFCRRYSSFMSRTIRTQLHPEHSISNKYIASGDDFYFTIKTIKCKCINLPKKNFYRI